MVMRSNPESALDWRVVGKTYFHFACFAGFHYVTVWVKSYPSFVDAVVGVIPRKEITENPGALGVLGLEVGHFLV